ncbi:MAG: hypothetical protein Q8914_05565 [Bacteroidota bacterium]|nr:hypothetical protein [Bacteroidota bacterium]
MTQPSTLSQKPVKKAKQTYLQPSDSTITFLMNFARLCDPYPEIGSEKLLN